MPNDTLPEWEQVLAAATHLQRILPDCANLIFDQIVGLED